MNTRLLLTALLLAPAVSLPALAQPASDTVIDLPAVQVRPDTEQRMELLARKIVDLAVVEVRPDALTLLQAAGLVPVNLERWIDIPALPSRPLVRLPSPALSSALAR